jgi:hypothetical protein
VIDYLEAYAAKFDIRPTYATGCKLRNGLDRRHHLALGLRIALVLLGRLQGGMASKLLNIAK